MLNSIYRLIGARKFELNFSDINLTKENQVIVRPTHLSICHADQRYYQGLRPAEIMRKKLPMALIHEGIGEVIHSKNPEIKVGDRVVMIPNTPMEEDAFIAENYLRTSKFRASGFDGFMQEFVALSSDRVVPFSVSLDRNVAAFIELMSVSVHAISRFMQFSHGRRKNIAIFGDGNLGFITAVFLRVLLPEAKLSIFGINEDKLANFTFADYTYHVGACPDYVNFDHAFECVGGPASARAIENIIDLIAPEGTISLLGVSEYPIQMNTRMILEKGLKFFGSSRSGRSDFELTVSLLDKHPEISAYLRNLISDIRNVRNMEDAKLAFEQDIKKPGGKTIMHWNV